MTRNANCPQCDGKTTYSAKYDTFGCETCLIWTEEVHTSDSCPGCPFPYPPKRPIVEDFKKEKL